MFTKANNTEQKQKTEIACPHRHSLTLYAESVYKKRDSLTIYKKRDNVTVYTERQPDCLHKKSGYESLKMMASPLRGASPREFRNLRKKKVMQFMIWGYNITQCSEALIVLLKMIAILVKCLKWPGWSIRAEQLASSVHH